MNYPSGRQQPNRTTIHRRLLLGEGCGQDHKRPGVWGMKNGMYWNVELSFIFLQLSSLSDFWFWPLPLPLTNQMHLFCPINQSNAYLGRFPLTRRDRSHCWMEHNTFGVRVNLIRKIGSILTEIHFRQIFERPEALNRIFPLIQREKFWSDRAQRSPLFMIQTV